MGDGRRHKGGGAPKQVVSSCLERPLSNQLRTFVWGGMLACMRILAVTIGAMSLVSCGEADHPRSPPSAADIAKAAPFPADDTSVLLNGELLEVPRSGGFLWNGQSIDAAMLSEYLTEKARVSRGKGRIVVQFEPGAPADRVAWVRNEIIGAGFCKWRGCAEARWRVVRPVVN